MAYRNGTYIAFHANGKTDPTASDIKYYNLIKAWSEKKDDDFTFVNSHDKTSAVRDTSKKKTLQDRLSERLRNSKNMILIIGETTKEDTDWVPFEIEYAIDTCEIPIIAAYTVTDEAIISPSAKSPFAKYWPKALADRIDQDNAGVIHIPFKKDPILNAIDQFDHNSMPKAKGYGWYMESVYKKWGLIK